MKKLLKKISVLFLVAIITLTSLSLKPITSHAEETAAIPSNRISSTFEFFVGNSTFFYDDAYFNTPASEYNHSFATTSLCLAMSAFNNPDRGYQHGYRCAEDMMKKMGFGNIKANEYYDKKPTSDSMGAVIGSKEITRSDGKIQPVIVMALRGGNYESEWAGNVTIGTGTAEHKGFSDARDIAVSWLNEYLKGVESQYTQDGYVAPKIWIVGYSRASATANLTGCFIDCALNGEGTSNTTYEEMQSSLTNMNVSMDDVYVYCFEVPQGLTYDSKYHPTDQSNIWCIVNPADPVPYVAPDSMGFGRAGTDVDPTEDVPYDEFMAQMNQINGRMAAEWDASEAQNNFQARSSNLFNLIGVLTGGDFNIASSSHVGNDAGEFCRKLVNDFLVPAMNNMPGKFFELIGMTPRELYTEYLQQPVQIIAKALMGSSGSDTKILKNALSKAVENNFTTWDKIRIVGIVDDLAYGGQGGIKITNYINGILTGILRDLSNDAGVSTVISKSDMQVLKDKSYYLSALIASMYIEDLFSYQYIATAKTYAADLFLPHYPEYVLAYMRAKDPNYHEKELEQYQLEISRADMHSSLENLLVEVYYVDEGLKYDDLIATIDKNGLKVDYENSDMFWEGGSAYSTEDRFSIYVNREVSPLNGGDYRFEIKDLSEDGSTQNLKIDYNIIKNGDGNNKKTEYYENTAVPIRKGDLFRIIPKKADRSYATFEKYITLTPLFVDENLKELENAEDGAIKIRGGESDSLERDLNRLFVAQKHTFEITEPEGTFFNSLQIPYYNEFGETVLDPERGTIQTFFINNPITWTIYQSSMPLYIVCGQKYMDGQVYADITYQHTGSSLKLVEEIDTTIPLKIENQTKGSDCLGKGQQHLEAEEGDTIVISFDESMIPEGKVFNGWSVKSNTDVEKTEKGTTLTFVMPKGGAEVHAMLGDKMDGVTLTFTGIWAHPTGTIPSQVDGYWKLVYIDPAYTDVSYKNAANYYPTKHIYKKMDKDHAGKAWIKAPGYSSEYSGDMVFDHWEAYYTDNGEKVTDRIAIETYYNWRTEEYETQYANPNGITNEVLVLENIKKSITVVPVYKPAEYTVHITVSHGGKRTKTYKAGETVRVEDAKTLGYTHESWSGYYNPLQETANQYGNVTRSFDENKIIDLDGTESGDGVYEFTMPKGDVYIAATFKLADYEVIWPSDSIRTGSGETTFHINDMVTILPDKIPHATHLTDVEIVSGLEFPEDAVLVKDEDGDFVSLTFKMEASDVVLDYTLEPYPEHNLKLKNATAEYADEATIVSPSDGNYTVYKNDTIVLTAEVPEGYYLKGWEVLEGEVEIISSGYSEEAYIVMPDTDLTIKAVVEKYKEVGQVDLDFTSEFAGNQWTPESAYVTGGGIQVQEESVAITQVADPMYENPLIFGFPYEFEFILSPAEGYYFGENTKVSLHGADCTVTIQEDGTAFLHCNVATGPAHITIIEDIKGMEGLPNGIALEEIKAKAPTVTQAFVEERHSWLSPLVTLDWENLQDADGNPFTYEEDDEEAQEFYVPVTSLDFSRYTQGLEYYDENSLIINPDVTYNNRIRITVVAEDKVSMPYVGSGNQPGSYSDNATVGLACETPSAEIYYLVDAAEKEYTAAEILKNGDLYTESISLTGSEGESKNYVIYAVATVGDEENRKYSEVAAFNYTIDIPVVIVDYELTVINGKGSGSYPFDKKTVVGVKANDPETNVTYQGFSVEPDSVTPLSGGLDKDFFTFYMPESDVKVVANYEITKLEYVVDNPVAGKELPKEILSGTENAKEAQLIDTDNRYITYYDENGEEVTGSADYETTYTGEFTIGALPEGFTFAEDIEILVNGTESVPTAQADGSLKVTYEFPSTDAKFFTLEVINGTAYDSESGEELPVFDGVSELYAGKSVLIKADEIEGKAFAGWEEPLGILDLDGATSQFDMPEENMTITATYKDIIDKVELTMDEPVSPDWILAKEAAVTSGGIDPTAVPATWTKDNNPVVAAEEPGTYLVSYEVTAADGFVFSENTEAFINGKACPVTIREDGLSAALCTLFDVGGPEEEHYNLAVVHGKAYDPDTEEELPVSDGISEVKAGETVQIKADKIEGKVFAGWDDSTGILGLEGETTTFLMPAQDVAVTALYRDIITKIDLTMNEPKSPDWILAEKAKIESDGISESTVLAAWTKENKSVVTVDKYGNYQVSFEITAADGFLLGEDAEAFLNGKPCEITVLDNGQRAVIRLTFEAGEKKPVSPDTGDNSNLGTYFILLFAFLLLEIFAIVLRRRKNK